MDVRRLDSIELPEYGRQNDDGAIQNNMPSELQAALIYSIVPSLDAGVEVE